MAIQLRRGDYEDFDKTKMQEGELAVVTSGDPNTESGCATYVSYASGDENKVKRLVHEEDYKEDFLNLGAELEAKIDDSFSGLELDEEIVMAAFDELNINGENLYSKIQELKPQVIVVGETAVEWKRATIVIPDLQFTYYVGNQYGPKITSAEIILDNIISDNIEKAVVISVLAQKTVYQGPAITKYNIGCAYCAEVPDGKYHISLYDRDDTEHDFVAHTVVDILYKTN